jgi:Ca2+-binding RTX toxin-like protein
MIKKINYRTAFWVLAILIFISTLTAVAAGNTIPTTRLDENTAAINANAIKPAACSALNLTAIVICTGGNCNGTAANELILGTSTGEIIKGKGGTDCIVGGGGDDDIRGNNGGDVCIGGPGADTFTTCETPIQ